MIKLLKSKSGAAMIMNICMIAVMTALCLSLLLAASVVLSTSAQAQDKEQSRILALTLSKELEKQIVGISFADQSEEDSSNDGTLWFYLKDHMTDGSWPYFNEDERGHTAKYAHRTLKWTADSFPEDIKKELETANTEILMYWESSNDASSDLDNTPLMVSVTCASGKSTCTITSEYSLECTSVTDQTTGVTYVRWTWSLNWRE